MAIFLAPLDAHIRGYYICRGIRMFVIRNDGSTGHKQVKFSPCEQLVSTGLFLSGRKCPTVALNIKNNSRFVKPWVCEDICVCTVKRFDEAPEDCIG